jgi:C4-dicarboxylate-specific signal transduction histidine kinase
MTTEMRKSGIDVLGDMPWGTHFCLFYETREDILETLVPYCKAGLEAQEFCLWVVAEPISVDEAEHALQRAVPDLDRYLADHSIEIVSARDWYLDGGTFDLNRVLGGWNEKLTSALARGYAGVRVTGDTAWLEKKDWKDFCEYEAALNESIANQRLAVLCTYPLAACGASEILDVVRNHQFATAKRHGTWDVLETPALKQAKAEIKRLNEELEERVVERTRELMTVNEELRMAELELAHVTRVTTLGEVTASVAHELNQPLAAIVNNANACLGVLPGGPDEVGELRDALADIVSDAERASAIIERVRGLAKRSSPEKVPLRLNEVVEAVVALAATESMARGVAICTHIAADLPAVLGDRVQLQQVLLNLVVNGMDAMSVVAERERVLHIGGRSDRQDDSAAAEISVRDCGIGFEVGQMERLFEPFYTTKADGMGMGLAISRSIIAAHGGRLWAEANPDSGATLFFTLPAASGSAAASAPTETSDK